MAVSSTFCGPPLTVHSTVVFWDGGISAPNCLCYSFNRCTKHTATCSGTDDCKLVCRFFFFYMYVCFTYTLKNQFKNTAVNYLPQRSIKKASC